MDKDRGNMYYRDKLDSLRSIFGEEDIALEVDSVTVGRKRFPIINDVIILIDPDRYTPLVKEKVYSRAEEEPREDEEFSEDIQFTFGREWEEYDRVLPEHEREFTQYFDLVDLNSFREARVCDLGCGIGRWSCFLKNMCKEIVLVDFSDAIFVARKNLADCSNCLFFMGDLQILPFKNDFCDFVFCLGVLHHLSRPCLETVRRLQHFAPQLLIFLYYSLEKSPMHFRHILRVVTMIRRVLCRVRHPRFRKLFSRTVALFVYEPLIVLGWLLKPLKLNSYVPLYEFYHDKSLLRIEQDVYDRFFTRIEQRVSRREIYTLRDSFAQVIVADSRPYWHFLCIR